MFVGRERLGARIAPTELLGMAPGHEEQGGGSPAPASTQVRASHAINNVVTIFFQNTKDALFRGVLDLSSVNYHSNFGAITEAALKAAGFAWSSSGKELWRRAEPERKLSWRVPKNSKFRSAGAPRATTLGGIADDLEHDGEAHAAGTRAEQRAAAAARPPPPSALELVEPDPLDRFGRVGSGWGNVPRPLGDACLAEQCALDGLVHRRARARARVRRAAGTLREANRI